VPALLQGAEDLIRALVVVVSALLATFATTTAGAAPVASSPIDSWQTNGRVTAIAVVGSTAYLGGEFTAVRPAGSAAGKNTVSRKHAAAIDLTTGALLPWNPNVNDDVRSIAANATSVYLGGEFSSVGGSSATRLAAVDPTTGKRQTAFTGSANQPVLALALSGTTLYAGGKFTQASGGSHTRIAALDLTTGKAVKGFSASADKVVKSLAVVPGRNQLVIGGSFDKLSSTKRESIGSLDLTTGAVQSWDPSFPYPVISVAADTDDIYVAGGGEGGNFVDFDPDTAADDWRGGTNGNAQAITVLNGVVYVGGHFTNYCGPIVGAEVCTQPTTRDKLLAVDALTGNLEPWSIEADSTLGVFALAGGGGVVTAGGDFTRVNGKTHQGFVAFD
jgi:nitrite reductase/ring-hydroxylating ferredoxin subunit